jgi:hypothetical protein
LCTSGHSAKPFGAALVRQFITGHARGDHGPASLFAGGIHRPAGRLPRLGW